MLRLSLICFIGISVLTPWDRGGMIFVSSARQVGGATAKLQEPVWGHIQEGEDDFRHSCRGGGGGTALS